MTASGDTPQVGIGLSLPNRGVLFGLPVDDLIEAAVLADESDVFDSVWVGDNFLSKPRLEALMTLAAIAGRTRRVRLGVICLASFVMRHPLPLALQWASLDVISAGRTILAVCIGGARASGPEYVPELDAMGIADEERVPRLVEGIKLLRLLWTGEPVTYDGRFYTFNHVRVLPTPVQARVPIVIAFNPKNGAAPEVWEKGLRRVARLGDGWQCDGIPVDEFRARWAQVRSYAAELGRADECTHSSMHVMVNINQDAEAGRAEALEFLGHYYSEAYLKRVIVHVLPYWLATGSPAAIADKINAYIDAGLTTPVLRFATLHQRPQIERFISEVAPLIKAKVAVG